jgi:Tfp pilus assembly protein FimT
MAMKTECHRRRLRACSFQEFRNAIRFSRLEAVRRRNLVKAWPPATKYYFGPPTASALLHEHGSLLSLSRGR